jgi:hypothetical protein
VPVEPVSRLQLQVPETTTLSITAMYNIATICIKGSPKVLVEVSLMEHSTAQSYQLVSMFILG